MLSASLEPFNPSHQKPCMLGEALTVSKQRRLNFSPFLQKVAKPTEVRKTDKPNNSQNNASVVEISY